MEGKRISEAGLDELGRVDYPVVETAADQANLSGEMAAGLFAVAERSIGCALDWLFAYRSLRDPSRSSSPTTSAMEGRRGRRRHRARPAGANAITWVKTRASRERAVKGATLGDVPDRNYRLVVEGELDDHLEPAFHGMTLTRAAGNTALTGIVRDQAELQGLLQRVSNFGLTLLEAKAIDNRPEEPAGNEPANAGPAGDRPSASRSYKKGADDGPRN
jgi:hypothetical protein